MNVPGNKLQHEILLTYLREMIRLRIKKDIQQTEYPTPVLSLPEDGSPLQQFISRHQLGQSDVVALTLALAPHLQPLFLTSVLSDLLEEGAVLPEFGGAKGRNHLGILPTGETLLFIVAGNDVAKRMAATQYFLAESPLFERHIITLEPVPAGEPLLSGKLVLDEEDVDRLGTGKVRKPQMGANFPAKQIVTTLEWSDLVLQSKTMAQIQEIQTWLEYNDLVMGAWGMRSKVKPGFRVMFYGPPGTGKTLTASLLGKYTGRDVYRIDLSLVVSKYIGETEKNLSKLFDKATDKDWILFFDEADSIFGKRTNVKDSHDKYANQEVSYLLQRFETHPGLVILASNLKSNIDSAFTRRFQSIVEFESPGIEERIQLWENNLPPMLPVDENVSLEHLSKSYNLTGANIANIVYYACLRTAQEGRESISMDTLLNGIKREYVKEGRMM